MKRKSRNWMETRARIQSPLPKLVLAIVVKIYAKADTEVPRSCPILLDFPTIGNIFCHWL